MTATQFKSAFPHLSFVTGDINTSFSTDFPSRIDHFMDFASTSPTLLTWSFISSCATLNYYRRDNVLIILQPLCTADVKFTANLFLEALWGWELMIMTTCCQQA